MVRKHGAGLYISEKLKRVEVETGIPNLVVVQLVELDTYVVSAYRPPSYTQLENSRLVDFLLGFVVGKEVVLVGDFNLPTLK